MVRCSCIYNPQTLTRKSIIWFRQVEQIKNVLPLFWGYIRQSSLFRGAKLVPLSLLLLCRGAGSGFVCPCCHASSYSTSTPFPCHDTTTAPSASTTRPTTTTRAIAPLIRKIVNLKTCAFIMSFTIAMSTKFAKIIIIF